MEHMGLGAGLGALGFWAFVAAVVVAGIWYGLRIKEAEQETLRRMVEAGQSVDPALMDKLLSQSGNSNANLARDLRVYGLVTLFIAPGLAVLAWFISQLAAWAFYPIMGAAVLVAFVAVGLLVAAKSVERADGDSSSPTSGSSLNQRKG